MADSKKIRVDARFRVIRNNSDVVSETPDTGEITFTDAMWNEIQLSPSAWTQLPFNTGMSNFKHLIIISDQNIGMAINSSGIGSTRGTLFIVSGSGVNAAPYVQNNNAGDAVVRYAMVD